MCSTDETAKGEHGRLWVGIYAWGSRFDLAARGLIPDDRLAIRPTAVGLFNLTQSVAISGVSLFNTTSAKRARGR